MKKKVTGIGGVFFKAKNPKEITEWYSKHLGLNTNPYGATFEWFQDEQLNKKAQTQWAAFDHNSNAFEPSTAGFMINYRVENLESLVQELKEAGVNVLDEIAIYDYGKFVHILDSEGNKVELWEPLNA